MKTFEKAVFASVAVFLLLAGSLRSIQTHNDAFTAQGLLKVEAEQLQSTGVTPHLEVLINADENLLWCGSFQLAWNEVIDLIGEDVHLSSEPAMVAELNKQAFRQQDLDAASYVAVADFVRNDVEGQIRKRLSETFSGAATPQYAAVNTAALRPQDIVAYSYLFKNLQFPTPFEQLDVPLTFGAQQVPCFGIGEHPKPKHAELLEQLTIRDYQSQDDFVVELKTRNPSDRVILAKVTPQATLAALVESVQQRADPSRSTPAMLGDVLKVPRLNFDITRVYDELLDKKLIVSNPKVAGDLRVVEALQNVRFQLNEVGVRLRSEARVTFGCSAPAPPPPPTHLMVFDKPFLILLQRSDAAVPYFALWVATPELLVK